MVVDVVSETHAHLVGMPDGPFARVEKVESDGDGANDGDVQVGAQTECELEEVIRHPRKRSLVRQSTCKK